MENFKKKYRDLEQRVMRKLRERVERSKIESKHMQAKAIPVELHDYSELVVVNDRLTFLDKNGYHYNLLSQATLEDLIDILN